MTLDMNRHHGPVTLYTRITLAVPKMVAAARRLIEKGEVGGGGGGRTKHTHKHG